MTESSPIVEAQDLRPGDYDVVLVSPHLDDVALSCPGALYRHRESRQSVLTVVPFSHAGTGADTEMSRDYATRRDEERRAAIQGGYDVLWGRFLDAPFRDPPARTFNDIVWGEGDDELLRRVSRWLQDLISTVAPRLLLAPLGIGRHIDHRIVFSAIQCLSDEEFRATEQKLEIWHYEDRPYALVRHAAYLRLLELGIYRDVSFEQFWSSFVETPYVKRHLTCAKERRHCRRRYVELHRAKGGHEETQNPRKATSRLIKAPDCDSIWSVMAEHESQIEAFVGSIKSFRRSCRRYTRGIDPDAPYLERQWRLYGL